MEEKLIKLLKKLEWSGQVCCPCCKALAPYKLTTSKKETKRGGGVHAPGCALFAALRGEL